MDPKPPTPSLPSVAFDHRGLDEQQAALNMALLQTRNPHNDGRTQMLINALVVCCTDTLQETEPGEVTNSGQTEAPPTVLQMMAQGDATEIRHRGFTGQDKASLIALRALIDAQLSLLDPSDMPVSGYMREQGDVVMS